MVRTNPRNDDAVAAFIESFAGSLTALGTPRIVARVISLMLTVEQGRLTSAEICAALQVSPAAVSGAMTQLREARFVTVERAPGTRRDVYVLDVDTWHDSSLRKVFLLHALADQLRSGAATLGNDSVAGQRLQQSAEFYDFIASQTDRMMAEWGQRREQRQIA